MKNKKIILILAITIILIVLLSIIGLAIGGQFALEHQNDTNSELTETNIKFFDMILTVLERKDLPKEDRETLKTFLIDIKHNMESNNDLNQRAEKILQD